jgi:threonine aldolase
LVLIENTHNRAGGAIFPLEEIKRIHAFTREHGFKLHMDGARLWNAHVATGIPMSEYGCFCDSVTVCLSKGLGAPVGSVLVGTREFIDQAHRYRKMWGGGMRQAGILAGAGLYALDNHVRRLALDHENAKKLATTLAKIPRVLVDLEATQTNIVIADLSNTGLNAAEVVDKLAQNGVVGIAMSNTRFRMVTHLDVSAAEITEAGFILEKTLNNLIK